MDERPGEITRLARKWADGDEAAFERLIDLVYDDLRRIARRQIARTGSGGTIDTTGLVHEAYLKLAGPSDADFLARGQFFAFCSKAMRRILIDYARAQSAEKRGGGQLRVPLSPGTARVEFQATRMLALDEALDWLEARDPRLVRITECRFFGGLTVQETAEALGTSLRTVEREWARARGYLYDRLTTDEGGG
jgi:RNA polymerase sigma factor (TIGR02999 family)